MSKKYILSIFVILTAIFFICSFRRTFFIGLDKFRFSDKAVVELRLENEGLRQEINDLKNKLDISFGSPPSYLAAQVYSRYPFNNDQALIINVGSRNGVKVGWPVVVAERYLLGKIVKVKTTTSEVITIFSPDWKSGVKIGQEKVEAVLVGGRPPKLDLIPANAEFNLNDEVVSVSPDLPLNFLVGKISEFNPQSNVSLLQATIRTDYDPNKLDKVFVITDYEGFD